MTAAAPARSWISGGVDIHVARSPEEFARIVAVRERVFRDEQGIVDVLVIDSDDRDSVHVYALDVELVVAIGRFTPPNGRHPEGQIAWVATLPDYRRRGHAAAIVRTMLEIADTYHVRSVLLSAQTHALPFYRQFGFVPYGKRFSVRTIEHQFMERLRPT